jgi:hypothetical protein
MEQDILTQQATQKVYNTNAFTIATILGGPLAAAYMASSNFSSFGEANKGRYAWMVAVFLLVIAMGISLVPGLDRIPNFIYVLLFLFIVQLLVHRFQAKQIRQHIQEGGQLYPVSRAIVVGLIFMIVLVVVIFGIAYLLDNIGIE